MCAAIIEKTARMFTHTHGVIRTVAGDAYIFPRFSRRAAIPLAARIRAAHFFLAFAGDWA
jgi:hypothetical protein